MKILLVVYDNDSATSEFPLGLGYIASVCRQAGHEVKVYEQNVYHQPEEDLLRLLDRERFDLVGLGVIAGYYQYKKLLKISEAINKSRQRPFYVLGGHGPAPEPGFFFAKTGADIIVIGEGEHTILEVIEYLQGKRSIGSIQGIAYRQSGRCLQTPRRPTISDIDSIPYPAWDLFTMEHYVLHRLPRMKSADRGMAVVSGRGCTFNCNFCYRMDPGFRPRSAKSIIEEIAVLKDRYRVSYISFCDELLMTSEKRTEELCKELIKSRLGVKWLCSGRLNYATRSVLKLMEEAGCVFISYGVESMDDGILKVMNKGLTVKQITRGVENTLAAGISPGINIIFGNIGETKEALAKGVDFLLKYADHAQLRTIKPVTPYPGSALYYYAIEKGMLKGCADFYEKKHLNSDLVSVNFTPYSDKEFHRLLYQANRKLLTQYYRHQLSWVLHSAEKLYLKNDTSFRGFRHA